MTPDHAHERAHGLRPGRPPIGAAPNPGDRVDVYTQGDTAWHRADRHPGPPAPLLDLDQVAAWLDELTETLRIARIRGVPDATAWNVLRVQLRAPAATGADPDWAGIRRDVLAKAGPG